MWGHDTGSSHSLFEFGDEFVALEYKSRVWCARFVGWARLLRRASGLYGLVCVADVHQHRKYYGQYGHPRRIHFLLYGPKKILYSLLVLSNSFGVAVYGPSLFGGAAVGREESFWLDIFVSKLGAWCSGC